jgi:DNA mismatch repair ATPase MutS
MKGLGFPVITETPKPHLKINGFFHPFIPSPVKNDIKLADHKNLCFVSGANMAGKSTSLKAVGLCVYLAHLGFPVPAKEMEVSLFNGLYSTINVSDDINKGYSHYYSEVRRVKEIALQIKEKKKVLVIFDELFRGTNVKDAFDATLMVSKGFTEIKDCLFFISTHIVEVAQELEKLDSVDFKCFESHLVEEKPIYNYKLMNGISTERLGVTILKNEKIMDIIDEIVNKRERKMQTKSSECKCP